MNLSYFSGVYNLEDGNGLKHMNTEIKLFNKLHWVKPHGRNKQHHPEPVTLQPTDATLQLSFYFEIRGFIFFSANTEIETFSLLGIRKWPIEPDVHRAITWATRFTVKLHVLLKEIKLAKAHHLSYPANYLSFTKGEWWVPSIIKPGCGNLADITYSISFCMYQSVWKMGRKYFLYKLLYKVGLEQNM